MATDEFMFWRKELFRTGRIAPVCIGMSQEELLSLFGSPSRVSTAKKNGKPVVFKYDDVEFHFDYLESHRLSLIYSDDEEGSVRLCIPPQ